MDNPEKKDQQSAENISIDRAKLAEIRVKLALLRYDYLKEQGKKWIPIPKEKKDRVRLR